MSRKPTKEPARPKTRAVKETGQAYSARSAPGRTERLNARITPDDQALLTKVAGMQGVSVSTFVIQAARARARAILRRRRLIRLSEHDQKALIAALLSPPEPNAALVRAARSHEREAARRSTEKPPR